jgi:hypothetical protein
MARMIVRRAQVAERRTRCIELRAEGKSWQQIADELGYKSRGAACQDARRALEDRLKREDVAVDGLRTIELEQLDALQRKAWEVLERPHLTVSNGKVVRVRNESTGQEITLRDDGPTLAAIDRLLRISERRARLLGMDGALKVEAEGTVRYEIVGVDLDKL